MITPGLEAFIQKGKARQHTFTYGGGAVGRIPVPKNSFIIIHHFDYWHFLDVPPGATVDSPASATISWRTFPDSGPFNAFFDFGTIGNFFALQDYSDLATSLATVQALWAGIMPGGSVVGGIDPLTGLVNYTFITTSPGTIWNGQPATMASADIVPPPGFETFPGVFARGSSFAALTHDQFLTHKTHQLEFRSTKGRNHFEIQEPIVIFPLQATPPPYQGTDSDIFFAYMQGAFYPKDTYLVHSDDVQINVLGVPPVANWAINFSELPAKSQEFPIRVGYGQGLPPLGAATAREIYFSATEQYLVLTAPFETIPPDPNNYREQFKVDANAANALFNPQNISGVFGSFPTYPLINIDYIQVDMNYNEFVKASNG